MTVSIATQQISFSWRPAERARIYLIQPLASGLTGTAPYTHAPGTAACAWPSLSAAISGANTEAWGGPVIFVVPELTLDPSLLAQIRTEFGTGRNRLLVAGLGHLTAAQCDQVETGVGSTPGLWERPAESHLFANGALVLPGPFLEAKNAPSRWERAAGCHWPHLRLRIFEGTEFRFAVLICSEMNDEGARSELLRLLAPYNLDAVFWLQHNPSPRHKAFTPLIEGLLDRNSGAFVICANKSSDPPRNGHYGASGFLLRADRMESDKRSLARPNAVLEGVSSIVARAVLPQYGAAVHCIETIRPAAVDRDATDSAANRLLATIRAFGVQNGQLVPLPDGSHVTELLEAGGAAAVTRAGLNAGMLASIATRKSDAVSRFARSADDLILFLDHAFRRMRPDHVHNVFKPHTPAAACRCWKHRENFDSLFAVEERTAVAELVLAMAAMPEATPTFKPRANVSITLAGEPRQLLLAWGEDMASEKFEREYQGPERAELIPKPAVVLDCRRSRLPPLDASRPAPDERDAASAQEPVLPRLYGEEFWSEVRSEKITEGLTRLYR